MPYEILIVTIGFVAIIKTCIAAYIIDYREGMLFGYDLGNDILAPLSLFFIFIPGSSLIILTSKYIVPTIKTICSICKFAINFIPNALRKRKSEKKRLFKEIEDKYRWLSNYV